MSIKISQEDHTVPDWGNYTRQLEKSQASQQASQRNVNSTKEVKHVIGHSTNENIRFLR